MLLLLYYYYFHILKWLNSKEKPSLILLAVPKAGEWILCISLHCKRWFTDTHVCAAVLRKGSWRTESNSGEVLKHNSRLKNNKSLDPASIHPRLLQELQCEIAVPIIEICTLSLKTIPLPEDGKVANFDSNFWKISRGKLDNYRPVSLMSDICPQINYQTYQKGVAREESAGLL